MNRAFRKLTLAALLLGGATAAWAGTRVSNEVQIDTVNHWARGNFAAARASTDATMYLNCVVWAYSSSATPTFYCQARNQTNGFVWCSSTNANLLSVVKSITSDSWVEFDWDANNTCTYLDVANSSLYAPLAQ